MSKKKHRNKNDTANMNNTNSNNRQQQMNYNNPFGINPNQLLSMFGNIDMNQINNMLQSMTKDGFDFNSLNLGPLQGMMNGFGRGNQQSTQQSTQQRNDMSQMNWQKVNDKVDLKNINNKEDKKNNYMDYEEDENIQMLNSLKNIVSPDKQQFIDKIISLYIEGAFEE